MSVGVPTSASQDDIPLDPIVNSESVAGEDIVSEAPQDSSSVPKTSAKEQERLPYLQTGPSVPVRPWSPGTVSNLSSEEQAPKNWPTKHPQTWREKVRAFWVRNLGLLYMLLAQIFGTMMNVTTRFLEIEGNKGKGMHPFQILFARMSITVVLSTVYMWWKKTPHFPFGHKDVRWLLVARGVGGFFGVFGMYYSLLYLPLSDATVITFLAPGLTCWVCSFVIKEPFSRKEKIGTFISLLGVVFIARPTSLFNSNDSAPSSTPEISPGNGTSTEEHSKYDRATPEQRLFAVGVACIGVCGAVVAYTTIRWIGKRAHPLITVNYFGAWSTIVSTTVLLSVPGLGFVLPADLKEWGLLFFLGTCGFVMQFLLAAGLSYEKSSRATNMVYTQLLFALSFDKFFFGVTPGWMSVIGSTLIIGSAILMALEQANSAKTKEAPEIGNADEERGLMGDEEDRDNMPIQEVTLRALR